MKTNSLSPFTVVWVLSFLLILPCYGQPADTAGEVRGKVDRAIVTRQNTQKKQDQWEQEKALLIAEYEQLKQQQDALSDEHKTLSSEESKHRELLAELVTRKQENLKIQKEMMPFLKEVQATLEELIAEDPPFLLAERKTRLQKLESVMNDLEITIAEKYRKVMEALFVEAEYGNTIEVCQEKIEISGNEILADIFRLGRISLFSLALDQQSAALFNVAENRWTPLDKEYIPSIKAAVGMGKKRRTVEVISLPVGRLAN